MRYRFSYFLINFSRFTCYNNCSSKLINVEKCNFVSRFTFCSTAKEWKTLQKYENALKPYSSDDISDLTNEIKSNNDALADCNEDVSLYAPYISPTFNLASFVNKSHTLQELVKLGVNLHRLESIPGIGEAILKLDFDRDVKKYIVYLNDLGIPPEQFGGMISKCPRLLFQDLDTVKIRLNYLESKHFSSSDIVRILTKNPYWITWKTQDIDYRLGFFQTDFKLSGDEVRFVAVRMPALVTFKLSSIKLNIFCVREEMGFSFQESKCLLLNKPKVYTIYKPSLLERFDYLHNTMKIPHSLIAQQPDGLTNRKSRMEARHGFLKLLSRDQYDPTKPNYVSMRALFSGSDVDFVTNIAKTSIQMYNKYLKTL